ncbi:MAG: HWE histidine kinase domain-containing protein [Pseudomonadota bacterium]
MSAQPENTIPDTMTPEEIRDLRHREAQLRAIFENAGVGLLLVSKSGFILNSNKRFAEYLGYEPHELIGQHYHIITAPEDIGIHSSKREALWNGELDSVTAEKRWLARDGSPFWTRMTVSVQWNTLNGEPTSIAIIEDTNEAKRNEESRRLLIGELNHRVKNTLAIVQGIIRQTLNSCPNPEDFAQVIEKRLQSVSRAHDLLTSNNWNAISLEKLVRLTISDAFAAYTDVVQIKMCHVELSSQQSITLSLIFHELMTNAIKYGALSIDGGRVTCTADLSPIPDSDDEMLEIRWTERGGPAPNVAKGRGFGSFLMDRGVRYALNGSAELSFEAEGLDASIKFQVAPKRDGHDINGNYFRLTGKAQSRVREESMVRDVPDTNEDIPTPDIFGL